MVRACGIEWRLKQAWVIASAVPSCMTCWHEKAAIRWRRTRFVFAATGPIWWDVGRPNRAKPKFEKGVDISIWTMRPHRATPGSEKTRLFLIAYAMDFDGASHIVIKQAKVADNKTWFLGNASSLSCCGSILQSGRGWCWFNFMAEKHPLSTAQFFSQHPCRRMTRNFRRFTMRSNQTVQPPSLRRRVFLTVLPHWFFGNCFFLCVVTDHKQQGPFYPDPVIFKSTGRQPQPSCKSLPWGILSQ